MRLFVEFQFSQDKTSILVVDVVVSFYFFIYFLFLMFIPTTYKEALSSSPF